MKVQEVLFVILEEYADWEAAAIAAALNEEPEEGEKKYEVKTVSLTREPVKSIGGFTVLPDYSLDSVPDDFAALILIGGNSWRKEESRQVMELVKKAVERKRTLGGICDASVFLGMNGLLNTVKHTSNHLDDLKQAAGEQYTGEAEYLQQQAVRDGNIITANGSAYLEFGKEVLMALNAAPQQEVDEWYSFFRNGYYEHMKAQEKIQ